MRLLNYKVSLHNRTNFMAARRKNNSKNSYNSDKNYRGKQNSSGNFHKRRKKGGPIPKTETEDIRINKYLANAGVCSRREADVLIESGVVSVNGEIITQVGTKIKPGDDVKYNGQKLNLEKPRYFLLNKPKNMITTMDDPQGRKTVMQIMKPACKERIYPVGRLDRNTTGLLLFTNDGDMAKKLTHPRYKAKKIYHIVTSKPVEEKDLETIVSGVRLEDGWSKADKADYVKDNKGGREIGVELHSGKNRVVRRMFEALGYQIDKLDRVYFAGLTKKNIERGHYRSLTEEEVRSLKMSK